MENEPGNNTEQRALDWNDVMITIVKADSKLYDLGLNDTQLGAIVSELTNIGTTFKKFYDDQSIKGVGKTILKCLVGEVVDIRFPSVVLMAQKMDSRMKAYDHWSGWSDMDLDSLISRMIKNISAILGIRYDLDEEYNASVLKYIRDQSADIANFAMMIAVNFGELGEKQMTESSDENVNQIDENETINPDWLTKGTEEISGSNLNQIDEKVDEMHTKIAEELREAQAKADIVVKERETSISNLTEAIRNLSPEILRNLKCVVDAHSNLLHLHEIHRTGIPPTPPTPHMEPSPSDVEMPYENTWARLESIEVLVHDVAARLEPVLSSMDTVPPIGVNREAITQFDGKLASITDDLYTLFHRIQI